MKSIIIDRGLYFAVQTNDGQQYPILKHPTTYNPQDLEHIKRVYLKLITQSDKGILYSDFNVEQLKATDDLWTLLRSLEAAPSSTFKYIKITLSKNSLNNVMKSL